MNVINLLHIFVIWYGDVFTQQGIKTMNQSKLATIPKENKQSYLMTFEDICDCIMHDPPAVLIDGVHAINTMEIVCGKYLSPDDLFFDGHFRNNPIYPAHVGIELIAQSGLVLMMKMHDNTKHTLPMIIGIERAKFRKPMLPGDQLFIKVNIRHKSQHGAKLTGTITVDGVLAQEMTLTVLMR